MLKNFVQGRDSILNDEIERVYRKMLDVDLNSEDYSALLTNLERLIRLKRDEKPNRVSYDTILIVCANLLGILIIVGYEQGHIITSRGLGFILKTRHQ